jgi:hypothetical protein
MAVSADGDIYVGEVSWSIFGRMLKPPRPVRNFVKLVKLSKGARQSVE